ncbi:hypothetical protein POTOM_047449 [Populus tomentosa]|uniref:Uncharacterized protein n=1 Tax=Populus tomentosa TaxID=118781 RepID=A0A8X7Y6Z9_POPTO|nr:hypothetical protein POTOM_047449 [Populus tomentosa]
MGLLLPLLHRLFVRKMAVVLLNGPQVVEKPAEAKKEQRFVADVTAFCSDLQIVICVRGSADCPAIPSSLWVVARYGLHVTKFGLPFGASSPAFPALLGELMWFYFADCKFVALDCGWLGAEKYSLIGLFLSS